MTALATVKGERSTCHHHNSQHCEAKPAGERRGATSTGLGALVGLDIPETIAPRFLLQQRSPRFLIDCTLLHLVNQE
jgi:hypothetical protein